MKKIQISLTLEKTLIIIGGALFSFFGVLYSSNLINYNFYGLEENGGWYILLGIIYILAAFSTKVSPGIWVKLWCIIFISVSTMFIIGLFIGADVDFKNYWLYLGIIPHIILISGAIIWIVKSYK